METDQLHKFKLVESEFPDPMLAFIWTESSEPAKEIAKHNLKVMNQVNNLQYTIMSAIAYTAVDDLTTYRNVEEVLREEGFDTYLVAVPRQDAVVQQPGAVDFKLQYPKGVVTENNTTPIFMNNGFRKVSDKIAQNGGTTEANLELLEGSGMLSDETIENIPKRLENEQDLISIIYKNLLSHHKKLELKCDDELLTDITSILYQKNKKEMMNKCMKIYDEQQVKTLHGIFLKDETQNVLMTHVGYILEKNLEFLEGKMTPEEADEANTDEANTDEANTDDADAESKDIDSKDTKKTEDEMKQEALDEHKKRFKPLKLIDLREETPHFFGVKLTQL